MLNLINPAYYLEFIQIDSSSTVSVHGLLPNGKQAEFRYTVESSKLHEHFSKIVRLMRVHGSQVKSVDELMESWIELDAVENAPLGQKRYVADVDLYDFPELIDALAAFDRTGRLTESSMRNWLNRSAQFRSAGQLPEAFRCAGAALARGHAPYLQFRVIDDTGQKKRVAEIMYEDGNIAEGVEILARLAYEWLEVVNLVNAQRTEKDDFQKGR